MLKYYAAAAGLKLFSINDTTVKAYRSIGNVLGGKRRSSEVRSGYFQRSDHNLRFIERHGAIAHGMKALELGTGWVHWEALFTRAFYDVEFTLFDVWDNRQFEGFLFYAGQLRQRMRSEINRTEAEFARAETVLDSVLSCRTFDEVYEKLGWAYLTDWNGSLDAIPDASLDLIVSSDVLEHVHRDSMSSLAAAHERILKPGAHAGHQIVFNDHLKIYDHSVHPKNYLKMSDMRWKMLGENRVQYINRMQASEIETIFKSAHLDLIAEEVTDKCSLDNIVIDSRFASYSRGDLETSVKSILLQKPGHSA